MNWWESHFITMIFRRVVKDIRSFSGLCLENFVVLFKFYIYFEVELFSFCSVLYILNTGCIFKAISIISHTNT